MDREAEGARISSDRPLGIGDVLYGFCEGFFGRDSYDDKEVEAIGADWVVVRERGRPAFADLPRRVAPDYLRKFRTAPDAP